MASIKATGPISKRGKEKSSRNAIKHGLNVATSHESDPLYHEIAKELLDSGFSHEQVVEAVNSLLEFRRVMVAYSKIYRQAEYKGDHFIDMARRLSKVHYSDLGYERKSDLLEAQTLFRRVARWDLKYGSLEAKRSSLLIPLKRYQRSAVSKLSKSLLRGR